MAIKKVTPEPQPYIVKISHNASDVFLDELKKVLRKEWNVTDMYTIENKQLPEQTAIVYDKYDQIIVRLINGKMRFTRTTKQERDIAILKNTRSLSYPVFPEKN